jgi:hypothetical protein
MIKEYHSLSAIVSQVEWQTVKANLSPLSAEHTAGSSLNAHVDASGGAKRYRLYNEDNLYDGLLGAGLAIQQRLSKWLSALSHGDHQRVAGRQCPDPQVAAVATAALRGGCG